MNIINQDGVVDSGPKVETSLELNEQRYRGLFEHMKAGVAVYEALDGGNDFMFRDFNKAAEVISCVKREDLLGRRLLEKFPHMDEFGLLNTLRRVYKTGKAERLPAAYYKDDQREGWRDNYVYKLPNGEVVAIYEDVTDKKLAEKALHEDQQNFLAFFESVDDIISVYNSDGSILYINSAGSRKLGYSLEEFKRLNVFGLHCEKNRQEMMKAFEDVLKNKTGACQFPMVTRDGRILPVETRAWIGKWSGKDCIYCIARDLSREQEALQKFNRVFYGNPCPMVIATFPEKRFLEVNDAFESALGFSRNDSVGKTASELSIFADSLVEEILTQQVIKGGNIRNREIQVRKSGGEIIDGLFSSELIESGGQKLIIAVLLDISERKNAERALAESEIKFRTFVDFTYDWEYWVGPDSTMKHVAPSCERITGYPPEAFVNDSGFLTSIVHPDDTANWLEHNREAFGSLVAMKINFRIITRGGETRWIGHICQPVFSSDGKLLGRRASNRDITERIVAEEAMKKLIADLENAMAEIKTLSGFIPICASCKKIRDDKGYWQAVEVYIRDRTDAQFSHSICPDCARKLYPEYFSES